MQMSLTPMVKNLLILNIGIFLIMVFTKVDLIGILGLKYIKAPGMQKEAYRFFTHMFVHADWGHLFSNMFGLFIFGPLLERVWGPMRFLAFYLICGLGASMLYSGVVYFEVHQLDVLKNNFFSNPSPELFIKFVRESLGDKILNKIPFLNAYEQNPDNATLIQYAKEQIIEIYNYVINKPMVGASGAIFGILMAFALLFPNTEMFLLFLPVPIKAKYFVGFYGLFEIYAGIQRNPGDNVAHFAHIGGMLFAFLLVKYWEKERNRFY
jgi:membrane associated rhomboid family serine protease